MKPGSPPFRLLRAGAGAIVIALWIGCGDERTEPNEPSPAPVASVTLSIENDTMLVASALHIDATPRDSQGTPLEDRSVAWSTSDPALATVLAGDVHARALGVVTITATSEGKSASAAITLAPQVTVSRRLPTTFAGDTTLLTATLSDAEGDLLAGDVDQWSSSDASVATVSADGIVTGVSSGTATIRASLSGGSENVELVVLEPRIRPNREISYYRSGPQNLRRIGADGDGDVELSDPAQQVAGYDWSPSGDRLALSYHPGGGGGKSGLYTMNADGSDERELVPDAGQNPRWSPDGGSILLIRGSPSELSIIHGDGGGLAPLTQMGVGLWNHEWSPDGRRIGVHRDDCREFWLLDFPGGSQQRVPLPTPTCEHAWSPDGKLIAYYSVTTGTTGIWLVNSDGSNPRPLTPNCTQVGACGGDRNYYRPRWSPDGRHLAFVSDGGGSGMVHVFDLDEGETTEFAVDRGFLDFTVAWSPDGTRLAFSGRNANGWGAVVVSAVDGGGQVALTGDLDSEVPVWRR